MIGPALDALDAWVDYRQSAGTTGSVPPEPIVTAIGNLPTRLMDRRKDEAREWVA
jgi:hypothetical protein